MSLIKDKVMTLNTFLLENSSGVTNTKIVCKDGIISSHKILVASTSDFIKNIMRDIPCNDDITLFLPDFTKSEVLMLIYNVIDQNISGKEDILFLHKSDNDHMKKNEDAKNDVSLLPPNIVMKMEETDTFDNDYNYDYYNNENDEEPNKYYVDVEKIVQESEFADELIENPKTKRHINKNIKVRKKALYQVAVKECKASNLSMRKIAAKYGLCHTSLSKFLRHGVEFKGPGSKNKNLTHDEEKKIVKTILKKTGGSKIVDSAFVRKIIDEELNIIKQNEPDRVISTEYNHKHNLLLRFGFQLTKSETPEYYECEVCYKRFTLKDSMKRHMKIKHNLF